VKVENPQNFLSFVFGASVGAKPSEFQNSPWYKKLKWWGYQAVKN